MFKIDSLKFVYMITIHTNFMTDILSFPETWIRDMSPNRITHRFKVSEKTHTNNVLMSFCHIDSNLHRSYIKIAYDMLSNQIIDEKDHMVETDVSIHELHNENGDGYYFMATDSHWNGREDDWPYLMRCMYVTKTISVEMTVLCYDKESETIVQAFDFLKNKLS